FDVFYYICNVFYYFSFLQPEINAIRPIRTPESYGCACPLFVVFSIFRICTKHTDAANAQTTLMIPILSGVWNIHSYAFVSVRSTEPRFSAQCSKTGALILL